MKTYLLILLSPLWVVFGYAQSVHLFQTVENSGLDSNSWLSQRVIPPETDNLGWVINYNAIMATCHIPQNIQRYQREEYLILPSEMAAGGFLSGFSINTIGFMAGMAGNGTQTGTLNIWLKNSSDLTYTLGSVWTTTDFTLVSSNPAFIVPTSGFYTIPFVNGSPFTYTGGSLYVAWEFVNPAGPIGTTKLYPLVNTGTSPLCWLYNSPTVMGDNLTASNSRPATVLFGNELRDILQATNIYTTERLPVPFGTPVTVTMRVSNISAAPVTFDATLTIRDSATSTIRYSETKPVTVPAHLAVRTNFTGWTPTVHENVIITVSTSVIAGETVVENNTLSIPGNVNNRLFSYHYSNNYPGATGFFTSGILATKFFMHGAGHVKGANIAISPYTANIGNTVYAVLMDSTGTIVSQSSNHVLSAADLGNMVSFTFPAPFPFTNSAFFAGIAILPGISGLYHPLGVCDESPLRYNTYYVCYSLSGGTLTTSTNSKYGIEAVVVAQPAVVTTAPTTILNDGATLNGTVNPNDDLTSVSFEYGLTTSYGSTIAGNPASVSGSSVTQVSTNLTGLPYNTIYHYRIVGTSLGGTVYGLDQTFRTGCSAPAGAAGPISGPSMVCGQTAGAVFSVGPVTNAVGYLWSVPPGSVITAGAGTNTITLTPGTTSDSVKVAAISAGSCDNGASSALFVEVKPLPLPTIGSSGTPCTGSTGNMYYTESGMAGYLWSVSSAGTIMAGQGTNALNVAWNGVGAQQVSLQYTGTNGCTSQVAVHDLFVDPLPSAAGNISGSSVLCEGTSGTAYSCSPILNATSYLWTLPNGATIASGAGTPNITVNFGSGASSGIIQVTGSNKCGSGLTSPGFNVTVHPVPEAPVISLNGGVLSSSAPSGNQWYYESNPIQGATGQNYTVLSNTGFYWCVVTVNGCSSGPSNPIWVVVTGTEEKPAELISVFPSPNNGRFTLSISGKGSASYHLKVYNQAGIQMSPEMELFVNGNFRQEINLQSLPNGVYTVAIIGTRQSICKKMVIFR